MPISMTTTRRLISQDFQGCHDTIASEDRRSCTTSTRPPTTEFLLSHGEKRSALMFALTSCVLRCWLEFAQCWWKTCVRRADPEIRKFCPLASGTISTVTESRVEQQRQFADAISVLQQSAVALQCMMKKVREKIQASIRHESDNCMTCMRTTKRTIFSPSTEGTESGRQ